MERWRSYICIQQARCAGDQIDSTVCGLSSCIIGRDDLPKTAIWPVRNSFRIVSDANPDTPQSRASQCDYRYPRCAVMYHRRFADGAHHCRVAAGPRGWTIATCNHAVALALSKLSRTLHPILAGKLDQICEPESWNIVRTSANLEQEQQDVRSASPHHGPHANLGPC